MLPELLLSGDRRPPGLVGFVAALSRWCRPIGGDGPADDPDRRVGAVLATTPHCTVPPVPPGTRLAVWVIDRAELAAPLTGRADVVLTHRAELAGVAGPVGGADADRRVVIAPTGVPVPEARPVSPYVRSRVRLARGLAARVIVVERDNCWFWARTGPIDAWLVPTALATATVADVASETGLRAALAWAAPTVTDPESARALGAVPDVEVLIGTDPDERARQARLLADDPHLAARLSWAGRLRYEAGSDPGRAAARVAGWLFADAPTEPLRRVDSRLEELGTPRTARIRSRLAEAVTGLAVTGCRHDAAPPVGP